MSKKNVILAFLLIIVGFVCAGNGMTIGALPLLAGILIPVISLLRRLFGRKKNQQPQTAIPNTPSAPVERSQQPVSSSPKPALKTETHRVTGLSYHKDGIGKIGIPNPAYEMSKAELIDEFEPGERIYEYTFDAKPELVPEPNNPHDPKAIRVDADGAHIGYIKAGSTSHIRKLLDSGKITGMDLDIYGGRLKMLEEDYEHEDEDGNPRIKVVGETHDYAATLTLYLKED